MPLPLRDLARAKSLVGWCLESPFPHSPQGHREPRPGGDQGWGDQGGAEADTDAAAAPRAFLTVLHQCPAGCGPSAPRGHRTPSEQELGPTGEGGS